ncbi:putative chaperone/heat shock protein Hsp12 [Morchella conica CCBAS932]|uniref:Putative chaperone/heat shock protein Hsp12 n=1 Tax=Morchella conica CCBAS932 TaxID=1392247 RepID=A0A3N4KW65_9PEZI|nr:putative chaperone/heat shock protein Hsp12 [Morchella conica CCBAS932]
MSDLGRKDFSTKAKEELTPDHSKSAAQRVKEGITDTTDRAAAGVNPDSNKSTTQEAFDKTRREKDHQTNDGPIDKVKNALGLDKH